MGRMVFSLGSGRRVILTNKQLQYYSRWFIGLTQAEIADEFGRPRRKVSAVIARARARNPGLPLPHRGRHRVLPLAAWAA